LQVFFRKKNRPRERFYLLPGQGGKNYFRKQRKLLIWSAAVALLGAGALAGLFYWLDRTK
jgi:hypothetical protein